MVNLTTKATGTACQYALAVAASTGFPQSPSSAFCRVLHFGIHSRLRFQRQPGTTDYDSGSCTVTLNGSSGYPTNFGQADTPGSVYRDASGALKLGEAKNGPTAGLNPNQSAVYEAAKREGATLLAAMPGMPASSRSILLM
jgi:hypothetical protein